jgi:cytosine/adenosine deaminase-related metal-dependent hydrolase
MSMARQASGARRAQSENGSGRKKSCDLLVHNAYLVTLDPKRRVFSPGAIAVTGTRIMAVGSEREILAKYESSRMFDAHGAVVHPGFIDPHVHIVHGTCRGIFGASLATAKGKPSFADWKAGVTGQDEFDATALATIEMLRRGFTTFLEPGSAFETDAVAKAAETAGVRALLAGCYLWDQVEIMKHLGGLDGQSLYDRAPPKLGRCLDQLGAELHRNKDPDALVRGFVCIYGLGTASDELQKAAKSLAAKHKVSFQQHECYVPAAKEADRENLGGKSRLVHLGEIGVLDENAALVHMYALDDDDVAVVRETGASIIWCPLAYLKLAIADQVDCVIPRLSQEGVNVAIATDGAMDCTIGDGGPAGYFVSSTLHQPITPENIIEMQTISAAKAMRMESMIGSLEPGKCADMVIRTESAAESYPAVNPVHQLALTSREGSVDTVIINGDVVFRGGRSTRVDEDAVFAAAKSSVERRMKRLGLKPRMAWSVTR